MSRLWSVVAPLFLGSAALGAQTPPSAPQIFLVTIGVGEGIDARFGHNAIWVHDSVTGNDRVYNYGTYDFAAPNFVLNFIQGRPLYTLSVWPWEETVAAYRSRQRSLVTQELNLSPAQRAELVFLLEQNELPENRAYRYDYYLDNCSTRVRDLLDQVLGGALRKATLGVPASGNLRYHTQRSITNNAFLYFGIMALMGPSTDEPLDQWDEMFLPEMVQERVRELQVTGPGGVVAPLVKAERTVVAMDVFHIRAAPPAWVWRAFLTGVVLACVILTGRLGGGAGLIGRAVTTAWLLVAGLGGLLLVYVWFATNHVAAANNRNVLLLSPLALALIAQVRSGTPFESRWRRALGYAFVGSLTVGVLLAAMPAVGLQWNLQLAALVVPPSLAAWGVISRPSAAAQRTLR